MATLFSIFIFACVFLSVFALIRTTHTGKLSIHKTAVIGIIGFFFFLIQLLGFFTGFLGIVLACIGIIYIKLFAKKKELITFEFQSALAFLLTLMGYHLGYQILFILLLPELLDLTLYTVDRCVKKKEKPKLLYLTLNTKEELKHFNILNAILGFLSAGVIGFASSQMAVFFIALLVVIIAQEANERFAK